MGLGVMDALMSGSVEQHLGVRRWQKAALGVINALSDFCWSHHVRWSQPLCLGRLVLAAESTALVLFLTSPLQGV